MGSFSQRHKYRHIDQQGDNRECCTADSGDGKGKPKDLLRSIVEERDKSQDGGDDGQQDWDNLVVKCLEIKARAALRRYHLAGVVLVDNINSSIHHDTAQQHKRSKTSLVEAEARQTKCEEYAYKRHRNHHNNHQRLTQRLKYDGAHRVDYRHNQQDEFHLRLLLIATPAIRWRVGTEAEWQDVIIEALHRFAYQAVAQLIRANKIEAHRHLVRLA